MKERGECRARACDKQVNIGLRDPRCSLFAFVGLLQRVTKSSGSWASHGT
jgi:hypothetical protein